MNALRGCELLENVSSCYNFSTIAAYKVFISMCIEVVFFYIFPATKEIFSLVTFIFSIFKCLHLMCFLILVHSRDWNHIFHNYDQRLKKIRLLMRMMLTKCFFVRLVTFRRFFTCDRTAWIFKFIITKNAFTLFARVRDSQNSDFDDDIIANFYQKNALFKQIMIFGSVFMKFSQSCSWFLCFFTVLFF